MGSLPNRRVVFSWAVAALMLLPVLSVVPLAAGDGMPAYRLSELEDPEDPGFSSIFESRQLARVDLMDRDHQCILLFLSVYSMDPGRNLTIMVPLRTLPTDVSGEPMKESDFRRAYHFNRIEREVVEQDPQEANARFWEETTENTEWCLGSLLWSLPAEYSRQRFVLEGISLGEGGVALDSGGEAVLKQPQPVQHYEFDGFSIDVYGVDSGGLLEDYLADQGLVLPEGGGLDRYMGQYVAVIEAESRPPIDADDFELFRTLLPNTTARLVEELQEDPTRTAEERNYLYFDLRLTMESDGFDTLDREVQRELDYEILPDLVDACFGPTDFEGEVLQVRLPLDDGKVFFPLGTSAGWPNAVGDIDVLFRVPEGKDLDIQGADDAFLDGGHWYLFSMKEANPGFDLESAVLDGDEGRRVEASRADWLYRWAPDLGGLVAALVTIAIWLAVALVVRRRYGLEGPWVRNPLVWGMLGLSVLISIPGALLVYLMLRPLPTRRVLSLPETTTPLAMFPTAIAALLVVVVIA